MNIFTFKFMCLGLYVYSFNKILRTIIVVSFHLSLFVCYSVRPDTFVMEFVECEFGKFGGFGV